MIDPDGFRPNVAMVIMNNDSRVFWAQRSNNDGWQFPQGGMNTDETPIEAMYRELHEETAKGNGPVDAAFSAIKSMVKKQVKLEEFLVQAITKGSDDQGKVHIQIQHNERMYYGFSANTDIVRAATEAFIDAIAQIV